MQVAKAKGRLRGKPPKLSAAQQKHLMEVYNTGTHTTAELAELFNVARSTIYRTIQRHSTGCHQRDGWVHLGDATGFGYPYRLPLETERAGDAHVHIRLVHA